MNSRDSRARALARPVYERALALVYGRRGYPWTINGEAFRIDPRLRRFLGRSYEHGVAEYLRARVRPGDLCFDVGAHLGAYVLQFARWSGPTGRVVAFEPNADTRRALAEHVRMNGMVERVDVIGAAVSASAGVAMLHVKDIDPMSRLGMPNLLLAGETSAIEVPMTTVDRVTEQRGERPDWLLIDVEGYEMSVLMGARETLRDPRVKPIVEFHPSAWPESGSSRQELEHLIADEGWHVRPLSGQREPFEDHGVVALERA